MRHFQTSNASRRYIAGGFAFTFEPIENQGGSWLGVLAVELEAAASALAAANIPQITEITLEQFEEAKKKASPQTGNFRAPQRTPPSNPPLRVVEDAAPVRSTKSEVAPAKPVVAELRYARLDVPDELKLEHEKRNDLR